MSCFACATPNLGRKKSTGTEHCFNVLLITFESRHLASLFEEVMPFGTSNTGNMHFQHFSPTCFDISSWIFHVFLFYCITDQAWVSSHCVCLTLRLSISRTFLLHSFDKLSWNFEFDFVVLNAFILVKY